MNARATLESIYATEQEANVGIETHLAALEAQIVDPAAALVHAKEFFFWKGQLSHFSELLSESEDEDQLNKIADQFETALTRS